MRTKAVYGGAFPLEGGCITPGREWRHSGVKSLKDRECEGKRARRQQAALTGDKLAENQARKGILRRAASPYYSVSQRR